MAEPPLRYRQEVRDRYPKHVEACEELEAFAVANRPPGPAQDAAADAIVKTYARSSKTYMAATLLAGHGYGEQAAMLNRSLFEDMIVAHWIRMTPGAVDKLERNRELEVERIREALHRLHRFDLLADWPAPMPRQLREQLTAEFAGTRHWTGKSMDELVKAVESDWNADPVSQRLLWQLYELDHRSNNYLVHHTAAGLHAGIEQAPGRRTFKSGPSWVNLKEVFGSAFFSYANTISLVLPDAAAQELEALYVRHLPTFTVLTRPADS